MSITYTPTTNFGAKDSLPANDPAKVIKGAEFTTEYTAIQSAFALAAPAASPTITGTATFDDVSVTNGLTVDGTTLVVDDVNNNVGIGTASPLSLGAGYKNLDIRDTTGGGVTLGDLSGEHGYLFSDNTSMNLQAKGAREISLATNGQSRVNIDSVGNVGIGTASPADPLSVRYSESLGILSAGLGVTNTATGEAAAIQLSATAGNGGGGNAGAIYFDAGSTGSATDNQLQFNADHQSSTTPDMVITGSGDVGIGTSVPQKALTVYGGILAATSTGASTSGITIDSTATAGYGATLTHSDVGIQWETNGGNRNYTWGNGAVEYMRIDSSGNVGIGTDSPGVALDVNGGSNTQIRLTASDSLGSSIVNFGDQSNVAVGRLVYSHVSDSFSFKTNNVNDRMVIDSSGNVGIGTSSPSTPLEVNKTLSATTATVLELSNGGSGDGTHAELQFTAANTRYGAIRAGANAGAAMRFESGTTTDGRFEFYGAAGTEFMRIDASGNVGIGTIDPAATLGVNGRITLGNQATTGTAGAGGMIVGSGALYIQASENAASGPRVPIIFSNIGGTTESMRIDSLGNLLVGTTSTPTGASNGVQINASEIRTSRGTTSSVVHFRFFNANGQVGNISTSGSTTAYATSSDERLKENIVDAPAGNIDALQVRSFDWKADGERQTYGFIAQELETAAPYAVTKGETEDDMWAVDYSKLVPMLVKEIQDLKAEVEALKNA